MPFGRERWIGRLNLFLLGAGFNIDATREAGPFYGNSICAGLYEIQRGYPVADVLKLCFWTNPTAIG
jgi:hypothetical protein